MRKSVEPAGVPTLPEVGSIVEVRGATWAVTDVRGQGISRSPADESRGNRQHVVSLQSLEEDRMGEELSVIWELEVGQTVLPDQGLPDIINADSFDDPNRLGAFVDAMRWGAVTSADAKKFQAPFRTGANLEPYQLEPLRRALSAPRTNLLLADDVGLGKTIEAGMVVEELLLRHRARTAIIVCPPSLCVKWREELLEKFGLDFVIVNSETLAESRRKYGLGANPFRLYPRVIVSMAWVPSIRAQRLLEEAYSDTGGMNSARQYSFDILVVDEAHHVAPAAPASSGRVRGYAVDSKRTETIRRLAEHCEHRLFLSATPHNGYSESFTALLEMVDFRRFTRGAAIDEKALEEVTVRRLKTNIASLHFKERHIETIPFTPGDDEEQHYAMLVKILAKTAKEHSDRDRALGVTALLFKKRLLSSPWAFARTLSRYRDLSEDDGYDSWMDDDYYSEVMGSGQSDEEEGREEQPEFKTLAGSVALNRQLTELADEYETSKRMMHLTEQAEKRVVDVSLDLTNQPPLITTDDPKVYRLPDLNPGWRPIEDGLRTVLDPDRVRPITFDADVARHNPDVAYMHLGSALMSKASRTLRGNLYGQESKLHRVTAVVVPGLDATCAAAMSRLVLVGRGGLRVHEEMFVTGLRFRAQNLAEEKVQTLLADALDASKTLQLADPKILERLEREWDANNGRLRSRLEDAIGKRAETRKQLVESNLEERRESDLDRAKGIFEQFRRNLRDSLAALRRQDEDDAVQLSLWEDEEQKQRKRDIRKMEQRLDDLDSEESRELDMIRLRYKDVKPYVSIAALVFAVSEQDAEQWRAE